MQYPRLSFLHVHTDADSFSVSSKRLNVNSYELSESEGMLRAVGSQHSLVWLFVPYWGPFISNAGSSFNEIPLFIFDGSCERAIKVASGRYEAFLAGLMSKARECKEDIVLEAERWETENGGKKETWKPREIDDMVSLEDEDSKWKGGMLPVGWESVPSRSRPGEISYYHRPSGQSQRRHPLDPHFLKQQRKLKAEKSFTTIMRRRLMSKFTSSRSPKGRRNARGDGDDAMVATSASSVVTRRQTGSSSLPPGWVRTPSRSNPGVIVYLHVKTGARSTKFPTAERQQVVLDHFKKEHKRIYELNPCEDVRPVESTVRSAEGGRRVNAKSTSRDNTTALSSPNNTIQSSRTVVTFGDTAVRNDETFADKSPSKELQPMQSTPISDWLNTVGEKYGKKFGTPFAERNVETLEQMLALDDHDFLILRKRLKAFIAMSSQRNYTRAHKQQTKLLTAMDKAFHQYASSSASSSDEESYADDWHEDDGDVQSVTLGGAPAAVETDEALEDRTEGPHSHRARDVMRVHSLLLKRPKKRSVAGSIDRGIYTLHFDATKSDNQPSTNIGLYFHQRELFWRIEVSRPTNVSPCFGEGMLIWFDSSSAIGTVDLGKNDNSASVKFVEAPASRFKGYTHGQQIDALTAYQTYEINPLVRFAQYGSNYSGRPDQNLPSKSSPLFVPKSAADTFVCTMCLHWPRQSKPPMFTLRACYIPETPLSGLEKDRTRKLKWVVHFVMLLATLVVVLTDGESQIEAISTFLAACIVEALIAALEFYVSAPLTVLLSFESVQGH